MFGVDGSLDEGDAEYLPLSPTATQIPQVIAKGEKYGHHLQYVWNCKHFITVYFVNVTMLPVYLEVLSSVSHRAWMMPCMFQTRKICWRNGTGFTNAPQAVGSLQMHKQCVWSWGTRLCYTTEQSNLLS